MMPTQELIAAKQDSVVSPAERTSSLGTALTRFLSWPVAPKVIYLGSDLFALTVAHMLALRLVQHFLRIPVSPQNPLEYHRYYISFFGAVLYLFEGYKHPELRRPEQELERSCKAVSVSFLGLVLFNFVAFRSQPFSRYMLVTWFCLALPLLLAFRFTLRALYGALWKAGLCRRRALLIGSAAGIAEYQQLLSIQRHHGYEFIGTLLDSVEQASSPPSAQRLPALGSLDDWERAVIASSAQVLVVAYPVVSGGEEWLGELLHRCKESRVDVELYSSVLATSEFNFELDDFSGFFRFYAVPGWPRRLQRGVKFCVDMFAGLIGSLLTVLVSPVIGGVIKLEDGGPIFYRSAYLGPQGQDRYYLKFRTMRVDADQVLDRNPELRKRFELQHKLRQDPRVTRVGRVLRKYSLDELPSFFSILHRDISLVGPRTIRQKEGDRYGSLLPKLLSVKPGLTGFWQVMGRQLTTYQERIQMDMFYIDHWSIWLDLVIIAKTFCKVLCAEGAY